MLSFLMRFQYHSFSMIQATKEYFNPTISNITTIYCTRILRLISTQTAPILNTTFSAPIIPPHMSKLKNKLTKVSCLKICTYGGYYGHSCRLLCQSLLMSTGTTVSNSVSPSNRLYISDVYRCDEPFWPSLKVYILLYKYT